MLPSMNSMMAWFPSRRAQWSSSHLIFCAGSSIRDDTRTGRRLTWNDLSATRAERLAERTAANVATASTSVPMAVAKVAMVAQLIVAMTIRAGYGRGRRRRAPRRRGRRPRWRIRSRSRRRDRGWSSAGRLCPCSIISRSSALISQRALPSTTPCSSPSVAGVSWSSGLPSATGSPRTPRSGSATTDRRRIPGDAHRVHRARPGRRARLLRRRPRHGRGGCSTSPGCGPSTTRTITERSYATRTGTTSKRCATPLNDPAPADRSGRSVGRRLRLQPYSALKWFSPAVQTSCWVAGSVHVAREADGSRLLRHVEHHAVRRILTTRRNAVPSHAFGILERDVARAGLRRRSLV